MNLTILHFNVRFGEVVFLVIVSRSFKMANLFSTACYVTLVDFRRLYSPLYLTW